MSTVAGLPERVSRTAMAGRRLFLGLVLLLVVLGLTGWLGVRTSERTSSAGGYRLSVRYPSHARGGLDVVWQVRVSRPGGLGRQVVLALTGDYLDIFETQGFHPEPRSETRDADRLVLTFDSQGGDTFVVDYDAYIQPASQVGRDATVALLVQGRRVASVSYTTHLVP